MPDPAANDFPAAKIYLQFFKVYLRFFRYAIRVRREMT